MYIVKLQKIPNQELSFVVDDRTFLIKLRTIQGLTFADIELDGEALLHGQICLPNEFINLYRYISANGKFYFKCVDNEYPYYEKFGDSQNLIFYTEDEL